MFGRINPKELKSWIMHLLSHWREIKEFDLKKYLTAITGIFCFKGNFKNMKTLVIPLPM